MKFTVRFSFIYYDEVDTTCCNIYDISAEEESPPAAFGATKLVLFDLIKDFSAPGNSDFVSLTDESGIVYGLHNGLFVPLSEEQIAGLPKTFCPDCETFFSVGADKLPVARLPT